MLIAMLSPLRNGSEPPNRLKMNDTEVQHHHAERGEDDRTAELVGDLDDAGAVEHEHHGEHRGRGEHGLEHDAVVERLVALGDGTDGEAVPDGVHRAEDLGQVRLAHGDDDGDETDDDADEAERRELVGVDLLAVLERGGRTVGGVPTEGGGGEEDDEQDDRCGDRAVDGHGLLPRRDRAVGDGHRSDVGARFGSSPAVLVLRCRFERLFVENWIRHGPEILPVTRCRSRDHRVLTVAHRDGSGQRRSCALVASHRSMSGASASKPVHAVAISTIESASKWAVDAPATPTSRSRDGDRVGDRGDEVDVATARLHPGEHDVLRQHGQQRCVVGVESQRTVTIDHASSALDSVIAVHDLTAADISASDICASDVIHRLVGSTSSVS